MNTPSTELKKTEAWLGSNWYPYGLGVGSGVLVMLLAHLFKYL